jgi:hypothetical protein
MHLYSIKHALTSALSCFKEKELPILKATSSILSIKDGDEFHEGE